MPEAGALDAVAVTGTRDDPRLRRAFVAALDAGEIQAVYQPVVDPVSGLMGALEALARWRFEGVDVPPSTFVPICVAAGRSEQLSALMLERACGQLAEWNAGLGHRRLRMAVNVDLRQRRAVPRRAVPAHPPPGPAHRRGGGGATGAAARARPAGLRLVQGHLIAQPASAEELTPVVLADGPMIAAHLLRQPG